jgi:predicted Ser/Thr protein kinase
MTLSPGDRLGPHEIRSHIGAGGMGDVYRARDTRLGRDVAIKVSTAEFTERFQSEARAIAALNYPTICTLYDVGPNYLVMEYVEGETLAEKLAVRPGRGLPMEEALTLARQIALALEHAHELGIVHRDLKPANIKVKPDGTVKVLDFGLAKMVGTTAAQAENSPTISMAATLAGVIQGTAGYMSPEQARGKPVDKRADIWAFGVVVYELLTGERLFKGEDIGEILAAVIKEEPRLDRVPARVRPLLQRCLEKDPRKRLRDIGDIGLLLDEQPKAAQPRLASWLWPAAAALLLTIASGLAVLYFRQTPQAQQALRFQIPPPGNTEAQMFTLSPDGRYLAFIANDDGPSKLWLRAMDALIRVRSRGRMAHRFLLVARRPAAWILRGGETEEDCDAGGPRRRCPTRRTGGAARGTAMASSSFRPGPPRRFCACPQPVARRLPSRNWAAAAAPKAIATRRSYPMADTSSTMPAPTSRTRADSFWGRWTARRR